MKELNKHTYYYPIIPKPFSFIFSSLYVEEVIVMLGIMRELLVLYIYFGIKYHPIY